MSRDDAAMAYMDVMLGFGADYVRFQRASELLTDVEKSSILEAVLDRTESTSSA